MFMSVSLRDYFSGCHRANTSVRPYGICVFIYYVLLCAPVCAFCSSVVFFGQTRRSAPTPRTISAPCSSVLFYFGRTHRFALTVYAVLFIMFFCAHILCVLFFCLILFWANTSVRPYGICVFIYYVLLCAPMCAFCSSVLFFFGRTHRFALRVCGIIHYVLLCAPMCAP